MKTIEKKLKSLDLELVIGLETHIELNTKTKVFCDCKNQDSKTINQHTCPVCRGEDLMHLKPNLEAIKKTIKNSPIKIYAWMKILEQSDEWNTGPICFGYFSDIELIK